MSASEATPHSPGFFARIRMMMKPVEVPKEARPLRIGVFGAARIAPSALIFPAKGMPSVEVAAVAARDENKANTFAKNYNIKTVHSSYEELVKDPTLDAVYIPLPNGLHYEWAKKSLEAGKHVLLEKPSVSNSTQCASLAALARSHPNLVLLEAFHYRFHPAARRLKELVSLGTYGSPKHIYARFIVPNVFGKEDIRFNFSLAGGGTMDTGCYAINAVRWMAGEEPESVESAKARIGPDQIDGTMVADLRFPSGCTARVDHAIAASWFSLWKTVPELRVETETHTLQLSVFVLPHIWHTLVVRDKAGRVVKKERIYGEGWSTYRYQLEAFVKAVRTGEKDAQSWVSLDDMVGNMRAVDMIYEKAGLERRS